MGEVKLTRAGLTFLGELVGGGIHCLDMPALRVEMAGRLKAQGLIERYFRGFGQWGYRITEAGRLALSEGEKS